MENKLDLILLEDLTRKYGKIESDYFPGKRNFTRNSYSLNIEYKGRKIEVHMLEYPVGNSMNINLELYSKSGPFNEYRRIVGYMRTQDDDKNLILLAGKKYKENKYYTKNNSTIIETKYTKNVKATIDTLKSFTYNKEGFERLVE